jgi:hypothetical protein
MFNLTVAIREVVDIDVSAQGHVVLGRVGSRGAGVARAHVSTGHTTLPLSVIYRLKLEPAVVSPGAVHVHVHHPVVIPVSGRNRI